MLGGFGLWEIVIILAVVLIVFGPHKLPELAKTLGRAMGEFRKLSNDFRRTVDVHAYETETKAAPPRDTGAADGPPPGYGGAPGEAAVAGAGGEAVARALKPRLGRPPAGTEERTEDNGSVALGRIALKRNHTHPPGVTAVVEPPPADGDSTSGLP